MKILVTGSNGQLGRELRKALEEKMPGVTTYTDVDELDIRDSRAVEKFITEGDFSHIVNCAAYTAVDNAESEQSLCYAINADAVKAIASAASKSGAKVLHISTDYVFDGNAHLPYKESDKVNPVSTYGTSKRKGEMMLLAMCPDAIIIRTAWMYSPHGRNFVKTMIKSGREKKELRVVADQIGTPTSAADLAQAILSILMSRQWRPGTYHYTDEGACSWYDFANVIFRMAGIEECKIVAIPTSDYPTAARRPFYSVLDKTLIKNTYNLKIPFWMDSLRKVVGQILENKE